MAKLQAPGAARRYEKGRMRAREGRKMSAISFSFARSGLANLLPATGGSPRCLRQLGSPPAIFLLPLRGYIAPRCAGQAKATPSRRGLHFCDLPAFHPEDGLRQCADEIHCMGCQHDGRAALFNGPEKQVTKYIF